MPDFSDPHVVLRAAHIIPGCIGLAAFWVPVFTKKGGRVHVFFGWIFVACAVLVIVSALASSLWGLIDPASFTHRDEISAAGAARIRFFTAFLGALGIYTMTPLWLAIRTVRTRKDRRRLGGSLTWPFIGLEALAGCGLIAFAIWWAIQLGWSYQPGVLFGVGALGLFATWDHGKFVAWPPQEKMTWWYKHMEYMLSCGIAFHTAFLVFGANRYIGEYLQGPLAFVPWFLPTAIGVPAISMWVSYYRKKFGDE